MGESETKGERVKMKIASSRSFDMPF